MTGHVEALTALLWAHQRVPTFNQFDPPGWQVCTCGAMPASDGPNSPRHAAHIAEVLAEYVTQQQAVAWDEGYAHCFDASPDGPPVSLNDNPHEKEADR